MANINIYPSTTTQTFTTTQDILLKGVNSGLVLYNADTGSTERFSISGATGTVFSVSDSQTGLLWSVNDIAATPIAEIYSDARIIYASDAKIGIGLETPPESLSVSGNIMGTAYFYIGDSSTAGSWRFYISSTDLVFERNVTGTWTEKGRFTN